MTANLANISYHAKGWSLYYWEGSRILNAQHALSNDNLLNLLAALPVAAVQLCNSVVNLDPRIVALLVAQELGS